jgi:3-dehydroquinate dehydratase/shikimate dehydrogenase
MHNAGFAALGLNAAYAPLHARSAADFAHFGRRLGIAGASITAPFKVALMDHVDQLEPLARRVGAINTIVAHEGRWTGTNTDVDGLLQPLGRRTDVRGARVSILGAGGAARAAAVALADRGARVTISARRTEAAWTIAASAGAQVAPFPPAPGTWDILVNTIPAADPPVNPIAGTPLDGTLVFDLVYVPRETPLLSDARAAGLTTIGGIEMLVAQAERQFELWTGEAPPAGLFAAAALADGAASA